MFIIFAVTALAALCWLLFHLATLALPLAVGISAATLAYSSGAGLTGAGVVGFLVGVITLAAGQILVSSTRSPALRAATAAGFAAPAALVGYSVVHRIMVASDATPIWAIVLGVLGAAVTGGAAIAKVSALGSGHPGGASLPASTSRATIGAPSGR